MKSSLWSACLALVTAACACAATKPVVYRLASLPATVEPGQELMLCAANIGTGEVDVSLEFINVTTGSVVTEKTVALKPLGAGTAAPPCISMSANTAAGPRAGAITPMASSDLAGGSNAGVDGQPLVVGVAMVRRSFLSFREAQVTASIQVQAPGAGGALRTVEVIPLSRTAHPSDGAPVYAPADSSGGHHK